MVVHLAPPEGKVLCPCCGRGKGFLPWGDTMSFDTKAVTCGES